MKKNPFPLCARPHLSRCGRVEQGKAGGIRGTQLPHHAAGFLGIFCTEVNDRLRGPGWPPVCPNVPEPCARPRDRPGARFCYFRSSNRISPYSATAKTSASRSFTSGLRLSRTGRLDISIISGLLAVLTESSNSLRIL